MSNYNSLKNAIDANIKQNGNQEITGQVLNSVLNQMVTTLGAGYQFAGVATTATNPGSPDAKMFYIANGKGTYTNFGGLVVTEDDVVVLYWDSSWHKVSTGIASLEKLYELVDERISTFSKEIKGNLDLSGVTFTSESYINISDGKVSSIANSNYLASSKIDVSNYKGLELKFLCTVIGAAGAVFYNSNDVKIQSITVTTESTTPQEVIAKVPMNAEYFRFTGYSTFSSSVSDYPINVDKVTFAQVIDKIPNESKILGRKVNVDDVTFTPQTAIRYTDGQAEFIANSKYLASGYISIAGLGGQTIEALITSIAHVGGAFYDINYEYCGGIKYSTTGNTKPQVCTAVIPSNAAYMRITGYSDYSSSISYYKIECISNLSITSASNVLQKQTKELYETVNKNISRDLFYSSLAIFQKFGVIGDSYASGEIVVDGNAHDYYYLSWGQIIARMCGNTCINFSQGGLTTKSWLIASNGLPKLLKAEAQQMYMICLGLNDHTRINEGTYSIGTIDDLHEDYSANPDTFYGNYGKIIGEVQNHAPNSKIIICTVTEGVLGDFSDVNPAIVAIAGHYNLPLIQLQDDDFFYSSFFRSSLVGSHPVAISYAGYAMGIMRLFSKCAMSYANYFKNFVVPGE